MTEHLLVNLLSANTWNPNVMGQEEYEALKQDMHVHGVDGIDPVLVSPWQAWNGKTGRSNQYIIVDGEHRWKAAKELGWKEISCEVREITEDDAKALCYRRNRERGTIDPFKEALLFKSELPKLTQGQIAGKYGVSQPAVSHRLSLLKLDEQVLDIVKVIPRGIVTPSHLEPIATLDPEDQKLVADELKRSAKSGYPTSVRNVEGQVQRLKQERAEAQALAKALETAKFPKCSTCREKPITISHPGLPWVKCRHYHTAWNLETGKKEYEFESGRQKDLAGNSKPIPPKTIRSVHTVKEIHKVFVDRIKEVIPTLDIEGIKVDGKLNGAAFSFDINFYGKSMSVSWHEKQTYRGFRAEQHEYRSGEKTAVDAFSPDHVKEVKELIENAFQGRLGVDAKNKRLKTTEKTSAEIIHELHSEPESKPEPLVTS